MLRKFFNRISNQAPTPKTAEMILRSVRRSPVRINLTMKCSARKDSNFRVLIRFKCSYSPRGFRPVATARELK